ncbi:MAG: family 10 glycosylhydrolase [Deltaproteobacteria bacterium]|nr:family 10 glycosylhydrolase [Deltaproteobacteria bacterium]
MAVVLLLSFISDSSAASHVSKKPYITAEGRLTYAMFMADDGEYEAACREFQRLIEEFPANALIEKAQYGLAGTYMKSARYKEAQETYGMFLSNFPDSSLAPSARAGETQAKNAGLMARLPVVQAPVYNPLSNGRDELRAVQILVLDAKNDADVDREFERLKNAGVNAVIFRVFHNKGDRFHASAVPRQKRGVYFNAEHAPVVDDILPKVLALAHARGLKVFAWMTTRYADYGVEEDETIACRSYDFVGKTFSRCAGLDLFNETAVKRLEAIYSDLADYDIDGILFQDDLVLKHNEGFGEQMTTLFRKDTRRAISPDVLYMPANDGSTVRYTPLFWEWAAWKNKRLLEVASRLRAVVRKKRPDALFAINLMYESITNPPMALAWLSQDFSKAVKTDFDYYSIMAYHKQMEDELGSTPQAIRDMIADMASHAARTVKDRNRVLIKLQTVDWKTSQPLPQGDIIGLISGVRKASGCSIALVPYRRGFPLDALGADNY